MTVVGVPAQSYAVTDGLDTLYYTYIVQCITVQALLTIVG